MAKKLTKKEINRLYYLKNRDRLLERKKQYYWSVKETKNTTIDLNKNLNKI